MLQQITDRQQDVARLCRQYRVRRLAAFGSSLREDFDPARSDLDFLVEFQEIPFGEYSDNYFGLIEALTALFERKVDLVVWKNVVNPYIRRRVEASQRELYAA